MTSEIRRRAVVVNGTLAVLLASGIGLAYASLRSDGAEASATTRTVAVSRGDLSATVSASGSVASAKTRSLSFTGPGTVERIWVEAGDKVKKGQKLARLDQTEAQENLDAAQADLNAAAEGDTDTAQGYATYVAAKNAVASAKRALNGTVIYAPFAGTITAVNGAVGGSATGSGSSGTESTSSTTSTGFIEIADPSRLQVECDFTEADATKLKTGQTATVTFDALSGVSAQGKVATIDSTPTTTNNVVTFAVTIGLTDKPSQVRIGQTASATVTVSQVRDVLYVPSAAVTTAGGQSTVTVVANGVPTVKTVTVGISGTQGTEIKSGLNEGEQVQITVSTGSTGNTFRMPGGGGFGGVQPGGGR